ncbi:MAG TPA: amidohydrolase [Chiayiivirga sp.]|nr:amidohydrolase [Chiayiivirga sp.]
MTIRWLLLVSMWVCCAQAQAAATLIAPVNGYTLDSTGALQRFEALLIDAGKVVATGSREALSKQAPDATLLDGQGRTLLPGLIDGHGHVMGLGWALSEVDLVGTRNVDEALGRIRAWAGAHKDAAWITGRGWNQVIWKLGRFPTAAELDRAVSDRPVWLSRVDGHAGWANTLALKQAGIDANTPDPVGGRIERGPDGLATGVLVDAAMALVESRIPPGTPEQSRAALHAALKKMASVGLTGVHDAGIDAQTYALYRQEAEAGRLSARIYAMIGGVGEDFDQIAAQGSVLGLGKDHLTVRSVKLYSDGALGSRGAAMLEPYSDDPGNRGLLFNDTKSLTAMLVKAMSKGFQVGVHAIGDAGNRQVLDAFAAAYKQVERGPELRNRIEHAQIVNLDDIPRFLPLKLIASMQPTHATSDMNMAEDRVGPQRILGGYAWQRFLHQGTPLSAGSDFPVESPNPFFGLHAAVTRQDHENHPDGGWYPEQRLSLVQALHAFTLGAAYAAHQEHQLGSLEPGKWADFIVVDHDIFADAPEKLWNTQVLETWVGGERVFAREATKP